MNHELYIFGSIVRGEVSSTSDVDVLVVTLNTENRENYPEGWSIYSTDTIKAHYASGKLFAWHLHLESICIFSPEKENLLSTLGPPAPYTAFKEDIDDLEEIMDASLSQLRQDTNSPIFEVGVIHTTLRDIAMSASWKLTGQPIFSRDAPFLLPVVFPLSREIYNAATLARHCSTRGIPVEFDVQSIANELLAAPLSEWVNNVRSRL